jgi:hypothetical protein
VPKDLICILLPTEYRLNMKIRIKGNSIRIRLTKTEVDKFGAEAHLEESTEFGNNSLRYAISVSPDNTELSASFEGNTITMWVPSAMQKEWVSGETVGYSNKMPIGNGKELFLLLEKDFVCLDNTFEDQSDNYPNPNAVC